MKSAANKIHNEIKLKLDEVLKLGIKGKTESLKIGVISGRDTYVYKYGKDYQFYDLASLTKVIFSVSAFMHYEDNIESVINKKVVDILPWFKASASITVKDVLAHQSGAPALYPVFNELRFQTFEGLAPLNILVRDIPFDQKDVVYSDVGFFVLGAILEQLYNKPLFLIFEDLRSHFQMGQIHFNILDGRKLAYPKNYYAPTEDGHIRQKPIQGEVHDENCWKMGGVGPHAGLFGRIEDVIGWLQDFNRKLGVSTHRATSLSKSRSKKRDGKFSAKTVNAFLKTQRGDWRLGLMVPSKPVSSCGAYFSDSSFGHLGFTGVSFWVDPKIETSIVILSNRTFPDRDNKSFNILRPLIHNIIRETLK